MRTFTKIIIIFLLLSAIYAAVRFWADWINKNKNTQKSARISEKVLAFILFWGVIALTVFLWSSFARITHEMINSDSVESSRGDGMSAVLFFAAPTIGMMLAQYSVNLLLEGSAGKWIKNNCVVFSILFVVFGISLLEKIAIDMETDAARHIIPWVIATIIGLFQCKAISVPEHRQDRK